MSAFDINQLTISGNLTANPELYTVPSGKSVCQLRIAHNDSHRNDAGDWIDYPQYFNVTIWGGLGEWVFPNVRKGQKVVIAGRLKWREYGAGDGTRREAIDIIATSIIPVPPKAKATPPHEDDYQPDTEDDGVAL